MQLCLLSANNLNCNTTSRQNISGSASLTITMTIKTQDKSKKRTKYRPIERPDGVVVLQRPYRPATSSSIPHQPPTFEKHIPTFVVPTTSKTTKQPPQLQTFEDDLIGIGAHLDVGRDGYNDLVDAGRGGYNDVNDGREELLDLVKAFKKSRGTTPWQRFLGESGPWSAFEAHEL
ncbi:hypothetical protein FB567DRAFT_277888 [Paraphoma chrysanthemicola]|uniref:Uncharacterized protein n=1 Tax=Paraphoma chrysanthemicola TaxID=798071 RepID=A0A8K0W1H1_9PLEO|nr:hypothetical protein FB567DRAFT_277888 [Paraphoma chrysanthemicola]